MEILRNNIKFLRLNFGFTQEQLANLLCLDITTANYYETGKRHPSTQILIKIAELFGITMDFLINSNKTEYPYNLKLLRMAKNLDTDSYYDARSSIEGVIKNIIGKKTDTNLNIKQDGLDIELQASFHKNLKDIRNHKKMTQPYLAKLIGTTKNSIAHYENESFPPIDKLNELSEKLEVSIHCLLTGEKLLFDFDDRLFGKTILSADHILSIDDHKMLIRYMEAAINNQK